jgi:hypothetical protein
MTDVKTTARSQGNATAPRSAKPFKHLPDPPFEVCTDRPKDIITARGVNAPPVREHKPLTAAVLRTAETGGSVRIKFVRVDHDRLVGRFKGIENRQKTLLFKHSLELDANDTPTHVRYWCERKPAAQVPPPPAAPVETAVVGRDVE